MARKIVDCFIFYNELDMLEFRLKELENVTDHIVLAEGMHTFRGTPKPLLYDENKDRYSQHNSRINHVITPLTDMQNSWSREWALRCSLATPLTKLGLSDDDIIVLADVDEIPDPDTLSQLKKNGLSQIVSLPQDLYCYNLTCRSTSLWPSLRVFPYSVLQTMSMENIRQHQAPSASAKGGWHFSSFMSVELVANKHCTGGHTEFDQFFNDMNNIKQRIADRKDIFDRQGVNFQYVPLKSNTYLPKNVRMLSSYFAGETLE